MYTLFDFITHVKVVEYLIALGCIAGYMLFWESLKPKPFRTVLETGREDLTHLRQMGRSTLLRNTGRLVAAPFIGLAYIVALPVGFAVAIVVGAVNLLAKALGALFGKSLSFEWRPVEAYFEGRKRKAKKETQAGARDSSK